MDESSSNESSRQPQSPGSPPLKHPLNYTLAGMSELDQFASDAEREAALREIAKETASVRSGGYWLGVVILVTVALATRWLAGWGLGRVVWPYWLEETLLWTSIIGAFWVTLRLLHRWGAPEELRAKLLKAGVPVCRKCGYSLRGLPLEPGRCPECGAEFDARVRELLSVGK